MFTENVKNELCEGLRQFLPMLESRGLLGAFVELEIQAKTDTYTFLYALAGQPARKLATGATRYLSTEVAGGFTGVYFGMYATSNGNGRTSPADFDWFDYLPA